MKFWEQMRVEGSNSLNLSVLENSYRVVFGELDYLWN